MYHNNYYLHSNKGISEGLEIIYNGFDLDMLIVERDKYIRLKDQIGLNLCQLDLLLVINALINKLK